MKFDIMKFSFTIIIFVSWSTLTTANESQISLEFPTYDVNEVEHLCKNEMISFNFTNSKIISINRNFISSPWITCLNFTNTQLQFIEEGAFNNLPNLTQLILSNNDFTDNLFDFGGHENLKILILNNAARHNYYEFVSEVVRISEEYPNLEILSVRGNYISDLKTSLEKTPFPKLKILDLSSNAITSTNFVRLLPNSLYFLDLYDNSLSSLVFYRKKVSLLVLNLDNNNLKYVKKYNNSRDHSDNPYNRHYRYRYNNNQFDPVFNFYGLEMTGLENLHYLSISQNNISFIESNAFEDTNELIYLNLSTNYITYLNSETFEKLQSLRSLDLSFNRLEDVPQISNETVISTLFLNCNNIKNIISNAFVQMPKLTKLLLGGNQINEINIKAFAHLSFFRDIRSVEQIKFFTGRNK
ncbi:leucine-rich repeat-containing G-protein coupled receptor 5-like [Cataglyphis hispanica]|uniref:leucine-rich repeat-containing G-protein coupled receptor 5-like n=1 Tax=Cataglyphis hispanica TaxID=1086592 RepID=UPI00217F94B4|nr:leucine-rich repeat-containing G-protein coupled receptor 5-like [Cataglyphis hispanica]